MYCVVLLACGVSCVWSDCRWYRVRMQPINIVYAVTSVFCVVFMVRGDGVTGMR